MTTWNEGDRARTQDNRHHWRIVGIDTPHGRQLRAVHESGEGPDYQTAGAMPGHLVPA